MKMKKKKMKTKYSLEQTWIYNYDGDGKEHEEDDYTKSSFIRLVTFIFTTTATYLFPDSCFLFYRN